MSFPGKINLRYSFDRETKIEEKMTLTCKYLIIKMSLRFFEATVVDLSLRFVICSRISSGCLPYHIRLMFLKCRSSIICRRY